MISMSISRRLLQYASLIWLFLAGGSIAGDSYGGGDPPRAEAYFTAHPPVVDGVWSEGEWDGAQPILFPKPKGVDAIGAAPCDVRCVWTKEGVYFGFKTHEAHPVYGDFKPGQQLYQEDVFEMFIDQIGDHRQYYEIQIDPAGRVYIRNNVLTAAPRLTPEKRLAQEFVDSELWRYDLPKPDGFQVASKMDSLTHVWSTELFLPASFVNRRRGGKAMESCTWRLNLARYDWDLPLNAPNRHSTFMYWAPVLPGHPHLSPEAMGWLVLKQAPKS